MNDSKDTTQCAMDGCECTLSAGEGIMVGEQLFCSSECARGQGCSHGDCNCAATASGPE